MMLNRICFISRQAAESLVPPPNSVIVSIHDRSEQPVRLHAGWFDRLTLSFHDRGNDLLGLVPFTPELARQCIDFFEQHVQLRDAIFVQCHLGQSRSAAIALFFAEEAGVPCFKGEDRVRTADYPLYNRAVYALLREARAKASPS